MANMKGDDAVLAVLERIEKILQGQQLQIDLLQNAKLQSVQTSHQSDTGKQGSEVNVSEEPLHFGSGRDRSGEQVGRTSAVAGPQSQGNLSVSRRKQTQERSHEALSLRLQLERELSDSGPKGEKSEELEGEEPDEVKYGYDSLPVNFKSYCSLHDIPAYEESLGPAWSIPFDNRIPLFFSRYYLEGFSLPVATSKANAILDFVSKLHAAGGWMSIFDLSENEIAEYNLSKESGLTEFSKHYKAHSGFDYPPAKPGTSVPWSRVIVMEGLNRVLEPPNYSLPSPGLFWDSEGYLPESVLTHRSCVPRTKPWLTNENSSWNFQLSFFELVPPSSSGWNSGSLYGRDKWGSYNRGVRKSAITIRIAVERGDSFSEHHKDRWTMAVLVPSVSYSRAAMMYVHSRRTSASWSPYGIIPILSQCMVENWSQLVKVLDDLLDDEQVSFMNPDEYVHLLYDDPSFSRSRFYFWAIGCLLAFESSLKGNVDTLDSVNGVNFWYLPVQAELREKYTRDIMRCRGELESLKDHVRERLETIKSLRDGLFSASGVMESRLSRILSENVKLLTYVSIFFLPLAFSLSLWTIPEVNNKWPGISSAALSATIFAIVTYLLIFNLRMITSLFNKLFSYPEAYLVGKMKTDTKWYAPRKENDIDWSTIGERFTPFPRADEPLPSRWMLIVFAVTLALRPLGKGFRRKSKTNRGGVPAAEA